MQIDVVALFNNEGAKKDILGELDFNTSSMNASGFSFEKPVFLNGSISNMGGSLELEAVIEGTVTTSCARCTKELNSQFRYSFTELIKQADLDSTSAEDVIYIAEPKLDITDIAVNNFLVNAPMRYLCSEDCKGLCPDCGADLNNGECDCNKQKIDPRLEILNKLF